MIEIKENPRNGNGFDLLHIFEGWKTAFITYAEQYGELKILKRHTQTDEAFVLINGEATLFTADGGEPIQTTVLQKEKLYVVQKNTWHHLQASMDALLVVVENSNTNKENTECREIKKEQMKW